MSPIFFLHEVQIRSFIASNEIAIVGSGFSMDKNSVIHGYTELPPIFPSGKIFRIYFYRTENLKEISAGGERFSGEVFFQLDDEILRVKAFFCDEKGVRRQCKVKYVPKHSELYSRSKGLLETAILEKKKVGIVGLGSGGSPIAVELAKAGIGHFVLIDFDRIELSNVARHICGVNDLGRLKTDAVKDAILLKNPYADVQVHSLDVNESPEETRSALKDVDILVAASDNDRSRFFLNEIALQNKIPAVFGRAITRAIGGDVLRVRPGKGPCYNCLYSQDLRNTEEEISQRDRQAKKFLPDYTSEENLDAVVQVGLSSDIVPITNLMVKLILVEVSRGSSSALQSLEEDLVADFYVWANRREYVYESYPKLEYNFNQPTILRWYGARIAKDPECMVCSESTLTLSTNDEDKEDRI